MNLKLILPLCLVALCFAYLTKFDEWDTVKLSDEQYCHSTLLWGGGKFLGIKIGDIPGWPKFQEPSCSKFKQKKGG